MLTNRREAMTRRRVQTVGRLQALLAELLPGQGKRDLTTGQARARLASVRPRDLCLSVAHDARTMRCGREYTTTRLPFAGASHLLMGRLTLGGSEAALQTGRSVREVDTVGHGRGGGEPVLVMGDVAQSGPDVGAGEKEFLVVGGALSASAVSDVEREPGLRRY